MGFANLLIFNFLICFIVSFSIPEELRNSFTLGYGVILVSMILSCSLSLDWIFERDHRLGILQQIYLNSDNRKIISGKLISNYLFFCLPLALFSPVNGLFFAFDEELIMYLVIGNLCSGLVISAVTVLFSSITAGIRNGGLISTILSLPIYITLIIINLSFASDLSENIDRFMSLQNFLVNCSGLLLITFPITYLLGNIGVSFLAED